MGSAISTKPLEELDDAELRQGVEHLQSLFEDEELTGRDVVAAIKESAKQKQAIASLKKQVTTLETALKKQSPAVAEETTTAAELKAAGTDASAAMAAGFSAEACRDGGYSAQELYPLCAEFPFNDESNPTYDAAYNKLSILHMDGRSIVTEDSFGTMKVASWSPDMYAAPPAWTRNEDGWDIRNRKKARLLVWSDPVAADDEEP